MREDINKLRDDLLNLSASLKDVASDAVRERLATIRGRVDHITGDNRDYPDEPPNHIGMRPFFGAVLAFGAGLVIGRLLDR